MFPQSRENLQPTDQFPEKWYPILDPNALIYIPYPRVNCLKTIPFTAAHTHIAHIRRPFARASRYYALFRASRTSLLLSWFFYATVLGGGGHQETYFLWPYYRPHLSQFWKKVIFAIQLSHFLLMHLPYKAFQLELPEMNCHIFVNLMWCRHC